MRDRMLRAGVAVGVAVAGFLLSAVPAGAATAQAQTAPNAMSFGLLGPVGLVAVGVGVLGMIAGLARRRRMALARSVEARREAAEQTTAERAARVANSHPAPVEHFVPGPSRPPAAESAEPARNR